MGSFLFTALPTGSTISLGALSGNGRIGSGNSVATTWSIGALNTNTTFSGVIINNFFGTGTAAAIKVGSGMLTLSGASTYSGVTNVSGGTLAFPTGGSSIGSNNTIYVGGAGGATLSINGGYVSTSVNNNFGINVGYTSGQPGTVNITSGTLSSPTGGLVLGDGSTSSFNQSGGLVSVNSGFFFGKYERAIAGDAQRRDDEVTRALAISDSALPHRLPSTAATSMKDIKFGLGMTSPIPASGPVRWPLLQRNDQPDRRLFGHRRRRCWYGRL